MISNIDSNAVLTRKQREELVVDLHFNQEKSYREIWKRAKMSLRALGEIVNRAREEEGYFFKVK